MINIEEFNAKILGFQHKLDDINNSDNLQEQLTSLVALRDGIEYALNECSNDRLLFVQKDICNHIKQSVNDLIDGFIPFAKDPNLLEKIIANNSNPKEIINNSELNSNDKGMSNTSQIDLNSIEGNGALVSLDNTHPHSETTAKAKAMLSKLKPYCINDDQEQANEEHIKPKNS